MNEWLMLIIALVMGVLLGALFLMVFGGRFARAWYRNAQHYGSLAVYC